jgi:dihydrofolate reductase
MPNDAITPFILAVPQADLKHWNLKEERQSMRKLIYAINLTLDGCCDHTKFKPPDDDEVLEHYTHLLRDFDLLVYGRKTYQLMVPYWPDIAKSQSETKADIEFAQTFVSKKKIVFSRSLATFSGKSFERRRSWPPAAGLNASN